MGNGYDWGFVPVLLETLLIVPSPIRVTWGLRPGSYDPRFDLTPTTMGSRYAKVCGRLRACAMLFELHAPRADSPPN